MRLYQKVRAVERVFRQLEVDINKFKSKTGLTCVSGCGKCCHKPFIEASPLEFLPLAYHLHQNDLLESFYEEIKTRNIEEVCWILKPMLAVGDKGFCGNYTYRGLICRAFGFTAVRDKEGRPRISTCKEIKATLPDAVEKANIILSKPKGGPAIRDYYQQLLSIDHNLGNKLIHINEAIKIASEVVLSYYAYRPRKRARILEGKPKAA